MFIDFVPNYREDLNKIGNGGEESFGSMCKLARAVTSLQSIFLRYFTRDLKWTPLLIICT